MLHGNAESRMVARKWYKLFVANMSYFDPSKDYLYFQCRCRGQGCPPPIPCSLLLMLSRMEKGFASRVIYEFDEQHLMHILALLSSHAPNANEVLFVDTKKGLENLAEGKLSDFTCDPKRYDARDQYPSPDLSLLRFYNKQIIPAIAPQSLLVSSHKNCKNWLASS